jgi:hypothetical protein
MRGDQGVEGNAGTMEFPTPGRIASDMRHIRSSFLVLILALLLIGGCSSMGSDRSASDDLITDFSRFAQDSTQLVGNWQWRQTVCCFGNLGVETPESSGTSEMLVVTEDDTVRVYRNDSLVEETTVDDYLNRAQWGVTEDSLVVSWAYIDGPQRVYVRDE